MMKKLLFFALALGFTINSFAQFSISGSIKDSLANPIPGATIKIANTYMGTYSKSDGSYLLSKIDSGTYLVEVKFIGYETQITQVKVSDKNIDQSFVLKAGIFLFDEVIVSSTRVKENSPIAHTNISNEDYEKSNLGQDIPFLLQQTPSMVSTSDAGAGVGYTGFRLRGSDASRINVTINGIPINDSESQSVYWVNMPDFASSTDNIQIQRGVGASTNGAAAFGGSVNLETMNRNDSAYGEFSSSYGSFNTNKNTIKLGTGLINNHWSIDGRLSYIQSDGYIDRANSNLRSYFLSGDYYDEKTTIKLITFAGNERTFQAWWGTPQSRIEGNEDAIQNHAWNNGLDSAQTANLFNSGRTYNYYEYENEIDNYSQDHYQFHLSHQFGTTLYANIAAHYTYGRGYFEQFRKQDVLANYGLNPATIGADTAYNSDIIRRRWLDNDFYGTTYSINYHTSKTQIILGGGYNIYDGNHFGEIIWAEYASDSQINHKYYDNNSIKKDFNTYLKADYLLAEKTTLFADLQVRTIEYSTSGIDNDLRIINVDTNFIFFNPKGGLSHQFSDALRAYASFSVGNREPVRSDFIDNEKNPKHETLYDYEGGIELKIKKILFQANLYYMDYKNQLVLTGALNDVGSPIRTNVDKSYRAGAELIGGLQINKKIQISANATLSQNKITSFTETLYDYTNGYDIIEINYSNTDIAFSPNLIAALSANYAPLKGLNLMLQGKYIGQQFLDNTSNTGRVIDAYYSIDTRASYSLYFKKLKELSFNLMANNITGNLYSSNGYTYSYIYGDMVTENFYYPQAGINLLGGVTIKF